MPRHFLCQIPGETHEKCPRNGFRALIRNASETLALVGHAEWAVDEVGLRLGSSKARQSRAADGRSR